MLLENIDLITESCKRQGCSLCGIRVLGLMAVTVEHEGCGRRADGACMRLHVSSCILLIEDVQ